MKKVLTVVIAIAMLTLAGGVVVAQSGNDLFQQALVKERTEGNLAEAIKLYQAIVQKYGSDRKLAAKALFQMGQAYEKLSNTDARKAYERIVLDFGDQKDVAANANRRLTALGVVAAQSQTGTMTDRLIWSERQEMLLLSITPDGQWMGTNYRDGGAIRNALSGKIVLELPGYDAPLIAPDGQTMVLNFHGTDLLRPNGGAAQLRLMSVAPGSKPRVLLTSNEIKYCVPLAWSIDAKSILSRIRNADNTWQIAWVSISDGSIRVLKSLEWRLLGVQSQPSLSPDGRYIAYSALSNNPSEALRTLPSDLLDQDIYILSLDNMTETAVTKGGSINESPVWAPDGSRIVFTSDRSGTFDLYSVAVRNGEAAGFPSPLKKDVGRIRPVNAMTRSGSYYYTVARQSEVVVAEMEPKNLTFRGYGTKLAETFAGLRPTWSPDGESIAFTKQRPSGEGYDLIVRSLKTGKPRTYSTGDARIPLGQVMQWFHDSSGLLQVRNSQSGLPFYRVDIVGGHISEVAGSSGGLGAVSPDNNVVYTITSDSINRDPVTREIVSRSDRIVPVQIVRSPTNASQIAATPNAASLNRQRRAAESSPERPRPGYAVPDGVSDFVLSPDGRTIALTTWPDPKTGAVFVARVNAADGTDYRKLYGPFQSDTQGHKLVWTSDGRTLLFGKSDAKDRWQIMKIPAGGGKAESTGLEVERLRNFDLSPGDSRIAVEVAPESNLEVRAFVNIPSALTTGR